MGLYKAKNLLPGDLILCKKPSREELDADNIGWVGQMDASEYRLFRVAHKTTHRRDAVYAVDPEEKDGIEWIFHQDWIVSVTRLPAPPAPESVRKVTQDSLQYPTPTRKTVGAFTIDQIKVGDTIVCRRPSQEEIEADTIGWVHQMDGALQSYDGDPWIVTECPAKGRLGGYCFRAAPSKDPSRTWLFDVDWVIQTSRKTGSKLFDSIDAASPASKLWLPEKKPTLPTPGNWAHEMAVPDMKPAPAPKPSESPQELQMARMARKIKNQRRALREAAKALKRSSDAFALVAKEILAKVDQDAD